MAGPRTKRIAFSGISPEEKKEASPLVVGRKSPPPTSSTDSRKRMRVSPMRNLPTRPKVAEATKVASNKEPSSALESLTKAAESLAEIDVETQEDEAKSDSKAIGGRDPTGKTATGGVAVVAAKAALTKPPDPPTGTTPPAKKKRPYRRTKRPKNYNDKSTITTTTPAAETPVNPFDALLGEAEDLLQAASDAQTLGRLKMASTYQLLLHTRLVGLAKRFDRAQVVQVEEEEAPESTQPQEAASSTGMVPTRLDMNVELNSPQRKPKDATPQKAKSPAPSTPHRRATMPIIASPASMRTPQRKNREHNPSVYDREHAVNQLANYLPSNIELDAKMMEHLARAAAELHHQRTGRKIASDGLLASPANNTQGVLHYNKEVCATGEETPKKCPARKINGTPMAWTDEEKNKFEYASHHLTLSDAGEIAKMIGTRKEQEVAAYMLNNAERKEGAAAMDKDTQTKQESSPKKKGRGRKPPTTAINTVPNANLDVRSLLQGKSLRD